MEMYRTANPGMTVRPRPWPRRVASSTELESIKWHSGRGLSFVKNPQTTFWNFKTKQDEKELFTLRFNIMNSKRVDPMVDRRSFTTWTQIYLTFNSSLSSQLITKCETNLRADTTKFVEKKESPTTKYSRPKKRRPNNRQVVDVWRGGGRPLSLPPYPLMDYEESRRTGTARITVEKPPLLNG